MGDTLGLRRSPRSSASSDVAERGVPPAEVQPRPWKVSVIAHSEQPEHLGAWLFDFSGLVTNWYDGEAPSSAPSWKDEKVSCVDELY